MFIIICKNLFRKNFVGITLFPFIFLKDKSLKLNKTLVNHEKIHIKQQLEMFVIFFYMWYLIEYFVRLIHYKNGYEAYKNISFEREAYDNENNLLYLKNRKLYSFLNYL